MKQNERERKRENILDDDFDIGRFFELATSNTINVNRINLHEIKNENLLYYTGDFELYGSVLSGEVEHKTNLRFENNVDVEEYINAIDADYDSEEVMFTGLLYKLNAPELKKMNRPQYGRGTDFKQDIGE